MSASARSDEVEMLAWGMYTPHVDLGLMFLGWKGRGFDWSGARGSGGHKGFMYLDQKGRDGIKSFGLRKEILRFLGINFN